MSEFTWNGNRPTEGAMARAFIILSAALAGVLTEEQMMRVETSVHEVLQHGVEQAKWKGGKRPCDDFECAIALIHNTIDECRKRRSET